jgi:hypothetical protein
MVHKKKKLDWAFVTRPQAPYSIERSVDWDIWKNMMTPVERKTLLDTGKVPKRFNLSKDDVALMRDLYKRGY